MRYIFLVAGKGTRLQPLTLKHPKSMFKLDKDTTLIQRMVGLIRKLAVQRDYRCGNGLNEDFPSR